MGCVFHCVCVGVLRPCPQIVVMEWRYQPVPMLVCTKDIPAGTPLRRAYGINWWRSANAAQSAMRDTHEGNEATEHVIEREKLDSALAPADAATPGGVAAVSVAGASGKAGTAAASQAVSDASAFTFGGWGSGAGGDQAAARWVLLCAHHVSCCAFCVVRLACIGPLCV